VTRNIIEESLNHSRQALQQSSAESRPPELVEAKPVP
jgi:hypothetical protein